MDRRSRAGQEQETKAGQEFGISALEKAKEEAKLRSKFYPALFERLGDFNKAIVRMICALRVDLHLPDDEDLFIQRFEETRQKAMASVAEANATASAQASLVG